MTPTGLQAGIPDPNQDRKQKAFDAIISKLEKQALAARETSLRLEEKISILDSSPISCEPSVKVSDYSGDIIGKINALIDEIVDTNGRNKSTLERIERLF